MFFICYGIVYSGMLFYKYIFYSRMYSSLVVSASIFGSFTWHFWEVDISEKLVADKKFKKGIAILKGIIFL